MRETKIEVLLLLVFLIHFTFNVQAQQEKSLALANIHYEKGNYTEAIKGYEKLLQGNKEALVLNAQLTRCYLMSSSKTKALKYAIQLKNSLEKEKISEEFSFIIARAYHITNNFDSAIYYYKRSGYGYLSPKEIDKYLSECANGLLNVNSKINADIINVGNIINTEFAEFMPYITADKSRLYYTAFRQTTPLNQPSGVSSYSEDIFYCEFKKGAWQLPNKIQSLSTDGHDACVGISEDGMIMFLYKGTNNGDLYITELKGHIWGKPEKFPYNTPGFEGSATLSPNGKILYFVHQPINSNNRDIYTCTKMQDGKWSRPTRIQGINTEYDEDCPYIHPDGKTLYFSSKGHSSMGGYDIFSSTVQDNLTWSTPKNIGYPINTTGDDINFTLSADGKNGFYSSDMEGGYGKQDIYSIRFNNGIQHNLELLVGNIKDAVSGIPMEAEITVTDNNNNEVVGTYHSNADDGHFMIALPCGKNYGIHIEKKGYLFYSENAMLECSSGYFEVAKNIEMQHIESGAKIILSNIFYESGKADLNPESVVELQKVIEFLKKNSGLRVEISGHTDNSGTEDENKLLSSTRALRVKEYLLFHGIGISASRLVAKGYGSSSAISDNTSNEGKKQNRRTEFKIL